jgi:hypothetical protein
MDIDFNKEEQDFLNELNAGKFKIERIPNMAPDYQEYEDRDLAAFNNYINSDSFKALNEKASRE